MKYGLIGEHLGHSFSKDIHELLSDYEYELCEVQREDFSAFATEHSFSAINVTIPYKREIIPYLSFIDPIAGEIGAVNTVINKGGELYGYNTDFYGMKELVRHAGLELSGKKVAILGGGGTSRTARAVAVDGGAREIITVSRSGSEGTVSYEALYSLHRDVEIVINTTPVGMFPDFSGKPIEPSRLPKLIGVIDAIYNPLRTSLVREAQEMGITAEGGLYMLVCQAVKASELFIGAKHNAGTSDRIFRSIRSKKENIVLTGMPASGKSTVGAILSKKLGRRLIDTDELIVKRAGMPITEIFQKYGEKHFRDLESEAVLEASEQSGVIIATGGGAILRAENISALKKNGRIYFIDRPLCDLIPTATRPLSADRESIEARYRERYSTYLSTANVRIDVNCGPYGVAKRIAKAHGAEKIFEGK